MGKGYKSKRDQAHFNDRNRDDGRIKNPELYQKAINDRINSIDQSIKDMESKRSAPAKVYGLEVLKLSKGVETVLKRNGINSANDFFTFSKSHDYRDLDGIGKKRYDELINARVRLGLKDSQLFSYLNSLEPSKKGSM